MMRKCHLNTCPVGVATQDPVLRKNFQGKPEYLINYFHFVAEEIRELMAQLGFRKIDEMIGRVDKLRAQKAIDHWKARGLDLRAILQRPDVESDIATHCVETQDHGLSKALDHKLIELCRPVIISKKSVQLDLPIRNVHRTVGAMLSSAIAKRYDPQDLQPDTIRVKFTGSAGQSFGAFLVNGVTFVLEGESNDYMGKGLSGGRIIIVPPQGSTFVPEETIIIGNVALYGATGGEVFLYGMCGERFAVRNSGAKAVVEGVGDHGCEYMTGGVVVVLGQTGRNFAAGMSGGVAFVLNEDSRFEQRCNMGLIELEQVSNKEDTLLLRKLVESHAKYTGSRKAKTVLDQWERILTKFIKVMPVEYRKVLEKRKLRERKRIALSGGAKR